MDLSIETRVDTVGTDLRWLGGSHGIDEGHTGTLSLTADILALKNTVGTLPSGIALGRITASKLYGLYDSAATDGREKLAGFLLSDTPVVRDNGAAITSAKVGIPVLKHGTIKPRFLPVAAHRAIDDTTVTSGQFIYVD